MTTERPTVAFITLGCKVNQYDSDAMRAVVIAWEPSPTMKATAVQASEFMSLNTDLFSPFPKQMLEVPQKKNKSARNTDSIRENARNAPAKSFIINSPPPPSTRLNTPLKYI